ncbi:MAG: DNA polymerase III subunit chi [Hydrogenophaga sp.]
MQDEKVVTEGHAAATDVAFHVNVSSPTAYASRLVRKAYLRGLSVLVLGDAQSITQLDALLWAMRAVEFVPHCRSTDEGPVLARSAVVLTEGMEKAPQRAFDALVNLGAEVPEGYGNFARLFEVVSLAEVDLQAARQRWRAYLADGVTPKRHEILG